MRLGAGKVAAMSAAILVGICFGTARAQDTTEEPVVAEPAAMAPENEIEADEGDLHEGYYYPKPQSVEHYPARVYELP